MKSFFNILFLLNFINVFAQQGNFVISNIFNGKLFGLGFNHGADGQSNITIGNLPSNCTTCDSIGNSYILAWEVHKSGSLNIPNVELKMLLNEDTIKFDETTRLGPKKYIFNSLGFQHYKKIDLTCITDTIKIVIPAQNTFHHITGFYILYECFKNQSDEITYNLIVNSKDNNPNLVLDQSTSIIVNPINQNKDVGLALVSNTLIFMNGDENLISFQGSSIGRVAGNECFSNSVLYPGSGVCGHFKYENGILEGIGNDTSDSLMNGVDGLANVKSYLIDNNSIFFSSDEVVSNKTNFTQGFVFVYSSPCEIFNFAVSPDTTICRNESIQLSATGGIRYEWQPYYDLSCSTCPNPIFTGDSSRFYTVRIWNNDSCSVVRPVKVNVTQLPEFSSITTSASTCEGATGKIIASASLSGESYAINGATPQATGNFFNLAPGFYTVTLQALNGCSKDSIVEVGSVISTNTNFTANPAQGNAPLMVNFSNQSTNANNYEWFLNGVSQGNNYSSELFDSIGIYTVQLIAWQNDPTCADTAFQTISVTSAGFYILGSSLVSASSNAQNSFSVLTNGTPIVKVTLYDAQGRLLKTKTNLLLIAGSNTIWSASELSDIASEMVLYRIEWQNAAESGELKGKVLFLK